MKARKKWDFRNRASGYYESSFLVFVNTRPVATKAQFNVVTSNPSQWVAATREGERSRGMDREHFVDLMLSDQKTFSSYAGLFMDSKGAQSQSFLDWCWEKYLDGTQPGPNSTGFGIDFYTGRAGSTVFQGIQI
jgi:hypothetical protein